MLAMNNRALCSGDAAAQEVHARRAAVDTVPCPAVFFAAHRNEARRDEQSRSPVREKHPRTSGGWGSCRRTRTRASRTTASSSELQPAP